MNSISVIFFALLFSLSACSQEPKPISYGKDACDFCKMTIMDKRFASEIMTKKGKAHKFDDLLCTVNFLDAGQVAQNDIAAIYVTDFDNSEFVNVSEGHFYKYEKLRSPMGGNVATFKTNEQLKAVAAKYNNGETISWDEILKLFKPE
jgi:copper chaperone NosL